jgi:hypothetical protein
MSIHDALNLQDANGMIVALSPFVEARIDRLGFEALTPAEQVFFLVWWLEAEVNNGGFEQYFWNSAGDRAAATTEALDAIGAPLTADTLRQAMSRFPGGSPPTDQTTRQDVLADLQDELGDVFSTEDTAFFEYQEDLSSLLGDYVRRHREDFTRP